MGPQFVHVDVYARKVAKGKKTARTAREIVSEAVREENHIHHLDEPQDPVLLFGEQPDTVLDAAEAAVEGEKDALGRKIRTDRPVLLAGAASFPLRWEEIDDDKKKADYDKWVDLTLGFLKQEYGQNLMSVLEHTDEDRPHVHFYAVAPKVSETKELHPGHAEAKGLQGAEAMGAYKRGCREFQDRFWLSVGLPVGLTREGPKRNRLTRGEWKDQKAKAQLVAAAHSQTLSLWQEAKTAWDSVEATLAEAQEKTKEAMKRAVEDGKAKTKSLIELLERKNKECDDTIENIKKKFPNLSQKEIAALDARKNPKPSELLNVAKEVLQKKTQKPKF